MHSILDFYQTLGWGLSALVIGTFLLAGTVKGVIGLGLPTVAMGLLGLAMLPAQAAALLIIRRRSPMSGNWRRVAICGLC